MKLAFSYQNDFFKPVLIGSLLGHLALFGASGFLPNAPEFSVNQGVNRLDIVILENKEKRQETPQKMLAIPDSEIIETIQVPKKVKNRSRIEKPIVSRTEAKAIRENDPIYLKNPAPIYPRFAREQSWEGTVVLKTLVQSDGTAREVVIEKSSGYQILDQSALKTVKKWKFRPAGVGELVFSSWVRIPIRFVLVDENKKALP